MCKKSVTCIKYLLFLATVEIIVAIIAAVGIGAVNVLATTHGVADVKDKDTMTTLAKYYCDVTMKTTYYEFTGYMGSGLPYRTDDDTKSYKKAYNDDCTGKNKTSNCDLKYAVWKWTEAYTSLGVIACIIVFVTGVFLLFLSCCREPMNRLVYGENGKRCQCCHCLCSCTAELFILGLNIVVFILFAFSWAIILGLKFDKNLDNVLADTANNTLNYDKSLLYYDFTFNHLVVGKSLWFLAVASLLCLFVVLYLLYGICCECCCCQGKKQDNVYKKPAHVQMDCEEV